MRKRRFQAGLVQRYLEVAKWATLSLRRRYPQLVAVMLQGSLARGEPGPFSDIDLMGVIKGRKPAEFAYFDEGIYISVGFVTVGDLRKEFSDPKQFFWARGSALTSTKILYDPKSILRKILVHWKKAEPSNSILESSLGEEYHHLVEYSGKLRNGWLRRDEYQTRYAARVIAQHVENTLITINNLSPITENNVWHQVLSAKKRPKHLETDYPLALGIVGTRNTSRIFKSAIRLSGETLRLVKHEFGNSARQKRFIKLLDEPLEKHGL